MPPRFSYGKYALALVSFATCVSMMAGAEGAYAQAKAPRLGAESKKEQNSGGGILKRIPNPFRWFGKKDQATEKQSPAADTTQIEDTESITVTEGSLNKELTQAESSSELQWSPDDRGFEQSAPNTGMLGLKDLIELALRNSDEVLRREQEIGIAEGKRDAERDWEDPQLRISAGRDYDRELQRPYTTTERQFIDSQGRDVTDIVGRDGIKGNTSRERRIREDRGIEERKITKEVTPGIDGDRTRETIETRRKESRNESSTGSSTNSAGQSAPNRETSSESSSSTTREVRDSFESNAFDPTYPDYSYRIRVRFPIPNFLEMKQRLRQAKAEIGIAQVEHEAARRSLIGDVRNAYERIEYLFALDSFDQQLLAHAEDFLETLTTRAETNNAEIEKLSALPNLPNIDKFIDRVRPDEIADVRRDISKLRSKLDENRHDIQKEKRALAELVGLGDPERIAFTNSLVELDVDYGKMDVGYLKSMAALKRPDLAELRLELEIAESETAEAKAKRFPTLNFIDVDWGQSYDQGHRSVSDFGAQIGMSIPIPSLFKNQEMAASKKEADARRREVERKIANIGNDVDRALYGIRTAHDYLLRTQEHVASTEANLKQTIESIEATPEDASRLPEARFKDLEVVIDARQQVVQALRDFNQAVRDLETAIGADLDTALGKEVK
ncbi:MAG: TolC family protein [Verrucomicrobiae bacterium]|nr:TolC family protein [Verrucomicrobiae bacterium]